MMPYTHLIFIYFTFFLLCIYILAPLKNALPISDINANFYNICSKDINLYLNYRRLCEDIESSIYKYCK